MKLLSLLIFVGISINLYSQESDSFEFSIMNKQKSKILSCKYQYDTIFSLISKDTVKFKIIFNGPNDTFLNKEILLYGPKHYTYGLPEGKLIVNKSLSLRYRSLIHKLYQDYCYGYIKMYHKNGNLSKHFLIDDGCFHGKYYEYYDNKQLKIDGEYKHHNKVGEWKHFHANGKLGMKGRYDSSYLAYYYLRNSDRSRNTDTVIVFNGSLQKPDTISIDSLHNLLDYLNCFQCMIYKVPNVIYNQIGTWTIYDTSGVIRKKYIFNRSKLIESIMFDKHGNKIQQVFFKKNRPVKILSYD